MKFILNLMIILPCIGAVASLGCSSKPSPEDAEKQLRAHIASESEGRINLTSFQKINAKQGEMLGIGFYELEFDAEIRALQVCKLLTGSRGVNSFKTWVPDSAQNSTGEVNWKDFLDSLQHPGVLLFVGDVYRVGGTLVFEETENGWRATDMRIDRRTRVVFDGPKPQGGSPIGPRGTMQFYFYDVESNEQFTAKSDDLPPILRENGHKAFKAYVFTCGSCSNEADRFVGYYEGFTEDYKQKRAAAIEAAKAGNPSGGPMPEAMYAMEEGISEGRLLSTDGKNWVTSDSPEGIEINIRLSKACDGKGGQLKPCFPGIE